MTAARVEGGGLVVMLDVAGQRIAALEDRVDQLERDLVDERALRASLEALLAQARAATT